VIFAKQCNSFQLNAGKYLVWVFCSGILQAVFDATELPSLALRKEDMLQNMRRKLSVLLRPVSGLLPCHSRGTKASMRNVALTAASHSAHCTDHLLVCFGSLHQIPNQLRLALQ